MAKTKRGSSQKNVTAQAVIDWLEDFFEVNKKKSSKKRSAKKSKSSRSNIGLKSSSKKSKTSKSKSRGGKKALSRRSR